MAFLSLSLSLPAFALGRVPAVAPTPTPEPTIGDEYYDLADDFELPTGVQPLVGRAHWTVDTANMVTDSGVLRNNVLFQTSNASFGDADWTDIDVTFDYLTGTADPNGTAWGPTYQTYLVWFQDANNTIRVNLDTTPARRYVTVQMVIAGTATNVTFNDKRGTAGGAGNVTVHDAGKLRVQIKGTALKVWLDGRGLINNRFSPPWDYYDLSTVMTDPAAQAGIVGVRAATYRWPVADAIAARTLDIQCESIDGAVGRDAYDRDEGTVTYTGWFSGTPTAWVSRWLDATDPRTVVRDWHVVTATVVDDSYSIAETLPLGAHYVIEHGWLDGDDLRHTTFSRPTIVARRIIVYGQSTAVGRGGGGSYAYPPDGAVPASVYNASANYTSGYMVNGADPYIVITNDTGYSFTSAYQTINGEPCIFEAYGVGGATMVLLMEGTTNWTNFVNALATRKGVIEAVIWDQGQGDADVGAGTFATNLANYPSRFMNSIVAPLRTLAGNPSLPFFLGHMGRYGSTTPPSSLTQSVFDSQRDAFRQMAFGLTTEGGGSDPDIHSSSHHDGLVYGDAYHPVTTSDAGYGRLNERDAWTISRLLLAADHDGRGPRPTGMTRSGAVLTIAIDMNGAASLQEVTLDTRSGTSVYPTQPTNRIKGWDFSTSSSFSSLLAVTSLEVDGETIKVTLASDPGAPVYARNLYGAGYNDSVMVHGVYSGGTNDRTIPVEPTMAGPLASAS